jgi:membrane protein implicated in regulation of membrane protease activity
MLDLTSVLIQFFIREAAKETMGRTIPLIGGYKRYLKRVRDLFGRLVSIVLQVEPPAWLRLPMSLRHTIPYWRRVFYCPGAVLRPDSQKAVYQENAVSRDYHLWWAIYYYSLGRDRLSRKDFWQSYRILKRLDLLRITIDPCPEACLIELYPLVELAILDPSTEEVEEICVQLKRVYGEVGCLIMRQPDGGQHDHVSVLLHAHRTLKHGNDRSLRVLGTLTDGKDLEGDLRNDPAGYAYKLGKRAYEKWLESEKNSDPKLVASRAPYWLQRVFHPRLPSISYYLGLPILLIFVALVLMAERIAPYFYLIMAAIPHAMGVSLSQGLSAFSLVLVAGVALLMSLMAGYALATSITGFRQPISTGNKVGSSDMGRWGPASKTGPQPCWKVRRDGVSSDQIRVVKGHLSVHKDGMLDESVPGPGLIGKTIIGQFFIKDEGCCFASHAQEGYTWQIISPTSGRQTPPRAIERGMENQEMLCHDDRLTYKGIRKPTLVIELTVVFLA